MTWSFDDIPKYVINLDRRRDRWMSFQNSSGFTQLSNLRRWSGTDGKVINMDQENRVSLFTKYNIVRSTRRSHMELNTKGGVGCYISHVDVWKDFLEKGDTEVGMILEDDALMDIPTIEKIKLFTKSDILQNTDLWDFCILAPHSGNIKHGAMYPGDETCMRLMEFTGLTGYLFTKKGIRKILPHRSTILHEKSWNLYPIIKTHIRNEYMKEKFHVYINTITKECIDGKADENVHNLTAEQLQKREIIVVDICEPVSSGEYVADEDPTKFPSVKANRGPLKEDWISNQRPLICCYKLVDLEFSWFGFQSKAESFMGNFYKKLFMQC